MERRNKNGEDRLTRREVREIAEEMVRTNVKTIADLEAAQRESRTRADRLVDGISRFCGSMFFVYLHVIWFALWIGINLSPIGHLRFDPFPFGLLTMVVSLEAILLSTFILITQNRQSQMADRRNHLDLQVNLLAEQENSKIIGMLEAIHKRLGIWDEDPEVEALEEATRPEKVIQEIHRYVEETSAGEGPLGVPERR
jgi:uncharacterized membrane protein